MNRVWGKPEIYRNLTFYPLYLCDYSYYELIISLLSYCKDSIADKKIIHMSYLKFLLCMTDDENIPYLLCKLLSHVTKKEITVEKNMRQKVKQQPISSIDDIEDIFFVIDNQTYNQSDFETIREILLEQNGISLDLINQFDPTLEKKINKLQANVTPIEFSEEIIAFAVYMHKTPNEIENTVTFYQFKKMVERMSLKEEFEVFKPLEASGQIKFKNGMTIKNWLSHIPSRGRYDDYLMDLDKFKKENDLFKVMKEK